MSVSVRSLLAQQNSRIALLESHDRASRDIIYSTHGANGATFAGVWISGLTQTTHLGIPDTELISPLKRASMIEMANDDVIGTQHPAGRVPLCAAFDADSGGDIDDIPALVAILHLKRVSMIIIEDKAVAEPGAKVNSLGDTSGFQAQADPHHFAQVLQAFKRAVTGRDMMVTARIESLTTRVDPKNATATQKAASIATALSDAHARAAIYRDEGGPDAIMIHSKSSSPEEVLSFLGHFRSLDSKTPLVVIPTTYARVTKAQLYEAGANVVIFANHLMRAKIRAIGPVTDTLLAGMPSLFEGDAVLQACLQAGNYSCLLHRLAERESALGAGRDTVKDIPKGSKEKYKAYRVIAETCAIENMRVVAERLVNSLLAGCEADDRMISVKELLNVNAQQVTVF